MSRSCCPTCSAGRCAALAVTSPKRSALVPDLPTLRELNLAAAEIEGWFIVLGPAGVLDAVVQRLNTAINKVLAAPATAEKPRHPGRRAASPGRRRTLPR